MHIFEKKITLKKKPCVHSIDLRAEPATRSVSQAACRLEQSKRPEHF